MPMVGLRARPLLAASAPTASPLTAASLAMFVVILMIKRMSTRDFYSQIAFRLLN